MSQSYDLKKTLVSDLHSKLSSQDIINLHDNILMSLEWNDDAITVEEIELIKDSLNIKENINKKLNKIVKETISKKYTSVKKSWDEMMESLSKSIGKDITLDDTGNYNICDCEPHHISIRPIVHDIFDVVAYKDGTDRTKILYVNFDSLKDFVKSYLSDDSSNYVDTAYDKISDNSKDKEGSKPSNDLEKDLTVDLKGSAVKNEVASDMNKEEDNPDQPMREVGDFKKMKDYPETKSKYSRPTLDKDLKKLVVKYGKRSKGRPRK
jgi:hypothetical protein